MKIILLRSGGGHRSLSLSRARFAVFACVLLVAAGAGLGYISANWQAGAVDQEVVAKWRERLRAQDSVVANLERKSKAQSAAVGKQLAEMQARLLRMEAIGAHMATGAGLEESEFDFSNAPAQGGPAFGQQVTMSWQELQNELNAVAGQLRRRETELNILDSVLVSEEINADSEIRGRPVKWGWLSSNYGQRVDPITGQIAWHSGVDFAGHEGSDVIAVASGVVTFAGERSGYGKLVEISHANGMVTRYAHFKTVGVVTGEIVKKGETVGTMGTTGRSTGPHVHFEVVKGGRTVDPAQYVKRRS